MSLVRMESRPAADIVLPPSAVGAFSLVRQLPDAEIRPLRRPGMKYGKVAVADVEPPFARAATGVNR